MMELEYSRNQPLYTRQTSQPSANTFVNGNFQRRTNFPRSGGSDGGDGGFGLLRRPAASNARAAAAGRSLLGRPRGRPKSVFVPSDTAPLPSPPFVGVDHLPPPFVECSTSDSSDSEGESTSVPFLSSISSLSFMECRRPSFVESRGPSSSAGSEGRSDRRNEEFRLMPGGGSSSTGDAPSASSSADVMLGHILARGPFAS